MATDAMFEIGSISKQYTAASILRLRGEANSASTIRPQG